MGSISIDKIIPKLGYVKNNVTLILNQINSFKQDGDDARLYILEECLIKYKDKKWKNSK